MHPAKLFTDKAAQSGCIIGTLTSFSSLFEWYSKGVKFSPTLENIDETQRVLAAECPTDHKQPRACCLTANKKRASGKSIPLLLFQKKNKINDCQEHSYQNYLDPLGH